MNDSTTVTSNMHVYAEWSPKQCFVRLEGNGGTFACKKENSEFTIIDGDNHTEGEISTVYNTKLTQNYLDSLFTVTRTGYTLKGWQIVTLENDRAELSDCTFPLTVTNSITLRAVWELKSGYCTVTFDANGGCFGYVLTDKTTEEIPVPDGQTVTMPSNPNREHYSFDGWYTAIEGGNRFEFSTPIHGDMTLYAHWTINQVTITFEPNYEGFTGTKVTQQVNHHSDAPLKKNEYVREGYEFVGWTQSPDGETLYTDQASFYCYVIDVTLYAQWRPLTVPAPTATPTPETPNLPQTGDSTPLSLWLALAALSGMGMALIALRSRKMRKQ